MNFYKIPHLQSSTPSKEYYISQKHNHFSSNTKASTTDNLHNNLLTVQYQDVLRLRIWYELDYRSSMSKYPTHRTVWHFLKKFLLKSTDCLYQLRRNKCFPTFWIVYLPTSRGQHHHIKTKTILIFQMELTIPYL